MNIRLLSVDAADDQLRSRVHPADWNNPTPRDRYHLVVMGGGTAGLVAAAGAAGLGAKVALIERDLLGGDCLNAGCVPSKALLRAARAVAQVRQAGKFGILGTEHVTVDFAAVMQRLRSIRAEISHHDSAERFTGLGVDVFLGAGKFSARDSIVVGGQTLRFHKAVIATGTRPRIPAIPGLQEAGFLTNESVFALTQLPRRMAILGAGPVGCELAQAFARFGSEVVLIGNHAQVLPKDDTQAAERVAEALREDGVRILTNASLTRVWNANGKRSLEFKQAAQTHTIEVDEILVATGRVPNTDALGLEMAGIGTDADQCVRVDDHLRTANPRVFAAGDVATNHRFTHAADAMARIVIANALFMGRARIGDLIIPRCTYTDPEVAQVGLTEAVARERNIRHRVFVEEFSRVDRAVLDGETGGFVKILVAPRGDGILGATIVSAHAGEMISEVTLAMVARRGMQTIARTIHPYPTQSEALKKVADAFNRTRLTPFVKWTIKGWLRWMSGRLRNVPAPGLK